MNTPAAWIGPETQLMPDEIFQAWAPHNVDAALRYRPLHAGDWTTETMTAQSFRQKLCELAPGALEACAGACGMTTAQFDSALEAGQVTVMGVVVRLVAAMTTPRRTALGDLPVNVNTVDALDLEVCRTREALDAKTAEWLEAHAELGRREDLLELLDREKLDKLQGAIDTLAEMAERLQSAADDRYEDLDDRYEDPAS